MNNIHSSSAEDMITSICSIYKFTPKQSTDFYDFCKDLVPEKSSFTEWLTSNYTFVVSIADDMRGKSSKAAAEISHTVDVPQPSRNPRDNRPQALHRIIKGAPDCPKSSHFGEHDHPMCKSFHIRQPYLPDGSQRTYSNPSKAVQACRFGPECTKLANGTCLFFHPHILPSREGEEHTVYHSRKITRDCKYGLECFGIKNGKCPYVHPAMIPPNCRHGINCRGIDNRTCKFTHPSFFSV